MYRSNHFDSQNDVSSSTSLKASLHSQHGEQHIQTGQSQMRSSSQIDGQSPQGRNSFLAGYSQYAEQSPAGGYPHQGGQISQHYQNSYQTRVQNTHVEDSHVQNNHGTGVSRNIPPQFTPAPQNGSEKSNLPALPHSSLSDQLNQVTEKGFADFRADAFEDNEVDTQISALFNAMGRASKLSQSQLAMRLQTTEEVVQALEAGRLGMLPDWEEMAPVVVRYAKFMNIDERPILRRLREQLTEHFLQRMTREKKNGHQTAGFNSQIYRSQGLNRHNELSENAPLKNGQAAHLAGSQESPLPRTDQTLKAIASGKPIAPQFQTEQPGLTLQSSVPPIEDRLAALISATSQSFSNFDGGDSKQASSNFAAHSQSLRTEMKQPLASNIPNGSQHKSLNQQPLGVSQGNARADYMSRSSNEAPYAYSNGGQFSTSQQNKTYLDTDEGPKKKTKWLKIAGNIAFILVLLIGFINWQPNRFWSGVDQLPKPIAKSIYDLFEFVMPDPLASVYRMNWVYVDDPRMRKSDKLAVPSVMKLPKIDFSKIGNISK